jgi:hypothetical protein
MSAPGKLRVHHEIGEVPGQGGFGVIYRAFENAVRSGAVPKTLHGVPARAILKAFFTECDTVAGLNYPKIASSFCKLPCGQSAAERRARAVRGRAVAGMNSQDDPSSAPETRVRNGASGETT